MRINVHASSSVICTCPSLTKHLFVLPMVNGSKPQRCASTPPKKWLASLVNMPSALTTTL